MNDLAPVLIAKPKVSFGSLVDPRPGSANRLATAGSSSEFMSHWEEIDPLEGGAWDESVSGFRQATPFHSSAWARVLSETYGHQPCYLRLRRDNRTEALVPLMEVSSPLTGHRGVCLPFSDFADPLFEGEEGLSEVRRHLEAIAVGRGWSHLEVRGQALGGVDHDATSSEHGFYAHTLSLEGGPEALFSALSSSNQRAIRKAEGSGLNIRISTSWADMEIFFRLHEETRRLHGAPPQPLSFFRNVHRHMIGEDSGFMVLAEDEGRAVAGAVFLRAGTSAVYKFGASALAARGMRPNNLVMWSGIKFLAESACISLHFGRTNASQAGLRRFKRSWGAEEVPLGYARFDARERIWRNAGTDTPNRSAFLFKKLPLTFNRFFGKIAYRHLD